MVWGTGQQPGLAFADWQHMRFANPEVLVLLALVPAVLWWSLRPRRHGAARFSTLRLAVRGPEGWSVWGPALLACMRGLAVAMLIVALARPQTPDGGSVPNTRDGIAIYLVVDNSLSMKAQDYDLGSQAVTRLDAVKYALRLFVTGGAHGLTGRPNDKIGLITFARYPDVACPATLDHTAVLEAIDRIDYGPPLGTNIGDALAWTLDRAFRDPAKQKVIVLLSDGAHNVKEGLAPLEAAKLAADLKIKVYTIGAVGNRFGQPSPLPTLADMLRPAQGRKLARADSVDEPMMKEIAAKTGGQYFRATDTAGLLNIYREIDRLETTRIEQKTRVSYQEWFLALVIPAMGLLLTEQLLGFTRLLRVP